MHRELTTGAAVETVRLGRILGEMLVPGDVIGLSGDLGCGKTTLAGGVIAGLGVTETVTSPTFIIIREYAGRVRAFHLDLYRLESEEQLLGVGVPDYLGSEGVALVEWCERLGSLTPEDRLTVSMAMTANADERCIHFEPHGTWWTERLASIWPQLRDAPRRDTPADPHP